MHILDMKISDLERGSIPFVPNDIQLKALHHMATELDVDIYEKRRSGVTTALVVDIVTRCATKYGQTIIVMSHQVADARRVVREVERVMSSVDDKIRPQLIRSNNLSIEFDRGNKVITASPSTLERTIRGVKCNAIYIDNFGYCDMHLPGSSYSSLHELICIHQGLQPECLIVTATTY